MIVEHWEMNLVIRVIYNGKGILKSYHAVIFRVFILALDVLELPHFG